MTGVLTGLLVGALIATTLLAGVLIAASCAAIALRSLCRRALPEWLRTTATEAHLRHNARAGIRQIENHLKEAANQ